MPENAIDINSAPDQLKQLLGRGTPRETATFGECVGALLASVYQNVEVNVPLLTRIADRFGSLAALDPLVTSMLSTHVATGAMREFAATTQNIRHPENVTLTTYSARRSTLVARLLANFDSLNAFDVADLGSNEVVEHDEMKPAMLKLLLHNIALGFHQKTQRFCYDISQAANIELTPQRLTFLVLMRGETRAIELSSQSPNATGLIDSSRERIENMMGHAVSDGKLKMYMRGGEILCFNVCDDARLEIVRDLGNELASIYGPKFATSEKTGTRSLPAVVEP